MTLQQFIEEREGLIKVLYGIAPKGTPKYDMLMTLLETDNETAKQAYILGVKAAMEKIPAEDKPKLGSENQRTYEDFAHGFNNCREKIFSSLQALIEK